MPITKIEGLCNEHYINSLVHELKKTKKNFIRDNADTLWHISDLETIQADFARKRIAND